VPDREGGGGKKIREAVDLKPGLLRGISRFPFTGNRNTKRISGRCRIFLVFQKFPEKREGKIFPALIRQSFFAGEQALELADEVGDHIIL
jgi:hypothetical protein